MIVMLLTVPDSVYTNFHSGPISKGKKNFVTGNFNCARQCIVHKTLYMCVVIIPIYTRHVIVDQFVPLVTCM
jgi:hypothetical protein